MMNKRESNPDKFNKLLNIFNKVANLPQEIADAVQEVEQEMAESSELSCIDKGQLDFNLIENDVRQIHRNLEAKGDRVLGSHLILDDEHDLMEIQTYSQIEDKTYRTTVNATVKEIINIPQEVLDELEETGRVELSLNLKPYR